MPTNYTVSGRILDTNGVPQVAVDARVFQLGFQTETEITTQRSITGGAYTLTWTQDPDSPDGLDIYVAAFDIQTSTELGRTRVMCNIDVSVTVDIMINGATYVGRTELERMQQAVDPILGASSAKDITTDDHEYVALRAGVYPPHMATYARAGKLADTGTIQSDHLYAFARMGLPLHYGSLLAQKPETHRNALQRAYDAHIIASWVMARSRRSTRRST